MLAAKGTSHTSSLEQPPPQKKQTSIVGLATRNATIAVASPEPLSSIEQPPPQKKQSSSAGLATRNATIAVASPEPLSSIEQPPPQTKQASIAEESISSRFQVVSVLWCCTISQEFIHRTTSTPEEASVQAKT